MFAEPEKVVPYFAIPEGARVADFGAGSGAYALALARRVGTSGRVYAIDVQAGLLERLAKEAQAAHLPQLHVARGDVEKAGGSQLANAAVEVVLLANLLFQSEAKYTLALEAKRVLSPGGRLIVLERQVPADLVKEVMGEAGFKLESEFNPPGGHYGLIFTK